MIQHESQREVISVSISAKFSPTGPRRWSKQRRRTQRGAVDCRNRPRIAFAGEVAREAPVRRLRQGLESGLVRKNQHIRGGNGLHRRDATRSATIAAAASVGLPPRACRKATLSRATAPPSHFASEQARPCPTPGNKNRGE